MANWLEKILPTGSRPNLRNLPTRMPPLTPGGLPTGNLPNASIIYGIAASVLFIIGLYFIFFTGTWVTGLLVMLPAAGFLGFALHFLKHPH